MKVVYLRLAFVIIVLRSLILPYFLFQAAMEQSVPGHLPHGVASRSSWGGLNVSYEMQQDPNKPG